MFSHVMIGSNDLDRSKTFYDAVIGATGGKPGKKDASGRLVYVHRDGLLLITKPIDGKPASCGNGSTLGLTVNSPEEGLAWHKAGVEHGGEAIEDAPGPRGHLWLAYLRDPDGNKLCALHRLPAAT